MYPGYTHVRPRSSEPGALEWLWSWYTAQCDGKWEHAAGLRVEHVPARGRRGCGLRLTVELLGTPSASLLSRSLSLSSLDGSWIHCTLTPGRFVGSADGDRLEEIIAVFRAWVDAPEPGLQRGNARVRACGWDE